MGRRRQTEAEHRLKGTFEKHPEREAVYKNAPKPEGKIGPPPEEWQPHPRSNEAASLFAAGVDTYTVAKQLSMTYEQALALRPGAPPSDEAALLKAWYEIVTQAPPGVLTISDRLWVEMTCYSLVQVRKLKGKAKASDKNAVKEFLGNMAMSPSDRTKVQLTAGSAAAPAANGDGSREEVNTFEQLAEEGAGKARPN
jgi:hypothetical protein